MSLPGRPAYAGFKAGNDKEYIMEKFSMITDFVPAGYTLKSKIIIN